MTELLDYLSRHFLTEEQLLAAAGLDAPALHGLQQRRMVPQPSYRLQLAVQCESFFGPHAERHALHCYAPGTPAWLAAVHDLADEAAARALFEARHQARLHALDPDATADLADAWRSFLDGTYGLCTRSGLPEDIASKEWAAALVESLIETTVETGIENNAAASAYTPPGDAAAMRARLRSAVDTLDAASSGFAPHERARSSRHRLVDQVRERYRLPGMATG